MSSKLNRQNEYLYLLRNHTSGLTIVILGLLFCALFVSPIGEFAINDDWSYAHNVKALYDRGEFEFSDWPAMTLIGQTIPAWIWSECFGLSFLNLRLLTLLFALGTLFFVYAIIGSVTDKRTATIGSLLVLVNPIFLALSFTFMTEVYYLFYLTGMLYFSHRYFKCRQKGDFAIMLLFFLLAILTRQIALLFAPVFGLVCLLSHKRNLRTIILAVMPFVLGLLAIIGYKWFRIGTGSGMGTFSSIGSLIKGIVNYPLSHYLQRLGLILL